MGSKPDFLLLLNRQISDFQVFFAQGFSYASMVAENCTVRILNIFLGGGKCINIIAVGQTGFRIVNGALK